MPGKDPDRYRVAWLPPGVAYRGGEGPPLGPPPKTPSGYLPPEPPAERPKKRKKAS